MLIFVGRINTSIKGDAFYQEPVYNVISTIEVENWGLCNIPEILPEHDAHKLCTRDTRFTFTKDIKLPSLLFMEETMLLWLIKL